MRIKPVVMACEGYASVRRLHAAHILSVYEDPALVRLLKSCYEFKQYGFSTACRTGDGHELPFFYVKAYPLYGIASSLKSLRCIFKSYHRCLILRFLMSASIIYTILQHPATLKCHKSKRSFCISYQPFWDNLYSFDKRGTMMYSPCPLK